MSRPIVGIDLGTTNSVVATVDDDGAVVILRNAVGAELTPSVVYFEPDGSVVVGEEAVASTAIDPDGGIQLIKRHMGTEFPLTIGGQDHTPESISALILRQLATAASTDRKAPVGAVITVPAYFGFAEREATYQAGLIAGLDVLELLDEPVAAAAHYGLTAGNERTVLVYDLGGGTFDTTVLRVQNGGVTVVATDGHHSLGGADIDQRLLDLVLARLEELLPSAQLDEIVDDKRLLSELVLDVEAAKRDLSARLSRQLVVRTGSGQVSVTVTRADLNDVCGDLFDTTAEIIERVLAAARGQGAGEVDDVIMVGGSSRIPVLAERLRSLLHVSPRLVEPDLAVAKGAALRAHHLAGTPQLAALTAAAGRKARSPLAGTVSPVAPRAVGILIQDSHDPRGERSFVEHFVTANTPLPVTRTQEGFGTILDNQESARIQVYEQAGTAVSAEFSHNRLVLDGELTRIPPRPAGSVIEITMRIAVDGRLSVIAREPVSGRELVLEAFVAGVVDSADTQRLTRQVGLTSVRG
jgi:molecular chaperone DnaK